MYFRDLTEYEYQLSYRLPNVYNVGWIGPESIYAVGATSLEFRTKLIDTFLSRGAFDPEVNLYRSGSYVCHVCGGKEVILEAGGRKRLLGASEIWIPGPGGTYYAAPSLIAHYVLAHDYLPPAEYIQAVLDLNLDLPFCAQELKFELMTAH